MQHFDIPARGDRDQPSGFSDTPIPRSLKAKIPLGRETAVLRHSGFARWSDLYPARQVTTLIKAAKLAKQLDLTEPVRNRIQLAIAGCAEMAGFLCRWDRFHPKPFEAMANHRFSALGLAVETNPFGKRGRGTLWRRLSASIRAAEWMSKTNRIANPGPLTSLSRVRRVLAKPDGLVVWGSSTRQLLPNGSVDLVVTDPPYYDAVQYAELAELFLAWAKAVKPAAGKWKVPLREEAVPNSIRGIGRGEYERLLSKILKESARTLKADGRLVLTYHCNDFKGWVSVGRALHKAGFAVIGLTTAPSENGTDHAKRGRLLFTQDLVIECALSGPHLPALRELSSLRTPEQRELMAAGRAIALHGATKPRAIAEQFVAFTTRMRKRRIVTVGLLQQRGGEAK